MTQASVLTKVPKDLPPGLEFEIRKRVLVGAPIDQGVWDGWRRRIVPILGGSAKGRRFIGEVLQGGADWQGIRTSDGVARLDARYTLRHEDGTIVTVLNFGVRRGPPDVMTRIAAGELVDPASYYFRTSPQFDVQPGPHQWLSENTFVCVGKRWPDAVELDIYRVL
jgi:hypothetical protein